MSLVTREFSLAEVVRSSSGEILEESGSCDFVIIYDPKQYSDEKVQKNIDAFMAGEKLDREIIIMPAENWTTLHKMMKDHYEIIDKEKISRNLYKSESEE